MGAQPFYGATLSSLQGPNTISYTTDAARAALGMHIGDIAKTTGRRHFTQPINAYDISRTTTIPYYSRSFATNLLLEPASILITVLAPLVFVNSEGTKIQTHSVVKYLLPWQPVAPYGTTATMTKSYTSQEVGMESVSRSFTCDLQLMLDPAYATATRVEAAQILGESARISLYRYVSARLVEYGLMERIGAGPNAHNMGMYNSINPVYGLYGSRFAVGCIADPVELIEFIDQVSTLIPPGLLSANRLHVVLPRGAFARMRMDMNFQKAKDIEGRMMFQRGPNSFVATLNPTVLEAEQMFSPVARINQIFAELPNMQMQPGEPLFNPLAMETSFAQYYYLPTFSDAARTDGGSFPCNPPIALYDATYDDHRVVRIGDAIRVSGIFNMGLDSLDQIERGNAFSNKFRQVIDKSYALTQQRYDDIKTAREIAYRRKNVGKLSLTRGDSQIPHLHPFLAMEETVAGQRIVPTKYIGDMEPSNFTGYCLEVAGKSVSAALGMNSSRHAQAINSIFNVLRKVENTRMTEEFLVEYIEQNPRMWPIKDGTISTTESLTLVPTAPNGYAGLGSYRGLMAIATAITTDKGSLSHLATEANAALTDFDALADDLIEIFRCNALLDEGDQPAEDGKGRHAALFQNTIVDRPYAWVRVKIGEGGSVSFDAGRTVEPDNPQRLPRFISAVKAKYDGTSWTRYNEEYAKNAAVAYYTSTEQTGPDMPKDKTAIVASILLGLPEDGKTFDIPEKEEFALAQATKIEAMLTANNVPTDVAKVIRRAAAVVALKTANLSTDDLKDPTWVQRMRSTRDQAEAIQLAAMLVAKAWMTEEGVDQIQTLLAKRTLTATRVPSDSTASSVPAKGSDAVWIRTPLRITPLIFSQIYEQKQLDGILASDPNADYTIPLPLDIFTQRGYGGEKNWRLHPDFAPLKKFTTRDVLQANSFARNWAHNVKAGVYRPAASQESIAMAPSGAAGNIFHARSRAGGAAIPNAPVAHSFAMHGSRGIAEHMSGLRANWEYKLTELVERHKLNVTLPAILELLYLFECVSAESFRVFEEKGVLIPADMLLLRANIRFQTEGILLVVAGSFATFVTTPTVRGTVGAETGLVRLDGTHSRTTAQLEPGGAYMIPHVWLTRYLGGLSIEPVDLGDEAQVVDWLESTSVAGQSNVDPDRVRSLICLLVPLTEHIDAQTINVSLNQPDATNLTFTKQQLPYTDEKLFARGPPCSVGEFVQAMLGSQFERDTYRAIAELQDPLAYKRRYAPRPFVAFRGPFKDAERNQRMQGVGPLGHFELQVQRSRSVYDNAGLHPTFRNPDSRQRVHK